MVTTLEIVDALGANQNVIVNSDGSGNFMPVQNIGDPVAGTSQGTPFFNDAVSGTGVEIKNTKGNLYHLNLLNTTAAVAYLRIWFLPLASVTVGTTATSHVIRLSANERQILRFNPPFQIGGSGTGLTICGATTASGAVTGAAVSVGAVYI